MGPGTSACVRCPLSWDSHGQPGMTLASTSRLHLPQADRRTAGPNGARSISYGRDLGAGTVTCPERRPTQTKAHRDWVPPQALWKRSGQHEPRKVSGHGAPFIEAVFQQANAYQRSRYSSDASRERSPLFRRTKASQAPANKKAPHKEALFIGEAITSSSWVPPSSPSGGLPGGASIRPGRFPRCRCAPVPAGECRTPGGPSRGRGSAG